MLQTSRVLPTYFLLISTGMPGIIAPPVQTELVLPDPHKEISKMKLYLPLFSIMMLAACDGCGSDAEVAEEPAKSEEVSEEAAAEDEAPVDPAPESDKEEEASEDAEESE